MQLDDESGFRTRTRQAPDLEVKREGAWGGGAPPSAHSDSHTANPARP